MIAQTGGCQRDELSQSPERNEKEEGDGGAATEEESQRDTGTEQPPGEDS